MPYKFNESRRHKIPKARYRVTNWPEYDAARVPGFAVTTQTRRIPPVFPMGYAGRIPGVCLGGGEVGGGLGDRQAHLWY
jgi:hypothetical protein